MIRRNEVFSIGHISKTRGLVGEVELNFTDDIFDRGESEYLILDIDGILVPFFWEEYRFKNDKTAIFKFEDIHDDKTSRRLLGCQVFYPISEIPEDEDTSELPSFNALTGFRIIDGNGQYIGTVSAVDTSSSNILLYLDTENGKEIIIPFHDDFLLDYNMSRRELKVNLPEGVVDLN